MDSVDVFAGVDRISNLPDVILSHIVSDLPIEDAIRTTVLAKRWRSIWKYADCLYFNTHNIVGCLSRLFRATEQGDSLDDTDYNPSDRFNDLITQILQSHRTNVKKCQIVHFVTHEYVSHVNEWVEILLRKKLNKTLILSCGVSTGCLKLPSGIFSANNTLQVLELENYNLIDGSAFVGCENLRILKLSGVRLDDKTITIILSSCHLLKELRLINCQGFINLSIYHDNLEVLELRRLTADRINIGTETLTVLIIDRIKCVPNYAYIYAPLVTAFHIYVKSRRIEETGTNNTERRCYLDSEDLVARCIGLLQEQDPSSNLGRRNFVSPFLDLQFLYTCLDINNIRKTTVLAFLFRHCNRLQKLVIDIQNPGADNVEENEDDDFPYMLSLYWDKKEIFESISNSLKEVELRGYRGRVLEVGLVRYLVSNALKLEKLKIGIDDKCSVEEVVESKANILFLPMASTNLSIILEPGPRVQVTQLNGPGGSFQILD